MGEVNKAAGAAAKSGAATSGPGTRAAAGKALREALPRGDHARWKPASTRRDPVAVLEESNRHRVKELVPIRYGRMLRSPFTFLRGSAGLMAYDLSTTPATGLRVQACGDCHLLNFGAFATPERNLIFDINDFDETLPPHREWDLDASAPALPWPSATTTSPTRKPGTRPSHAPAPTATTCASVRKCRRWTSGTSGWTLRP